MDANYVFILELGAVVNIRNRKHLLSNNEDRLFLRLLSDYKNRNFCFPFQTIGTGDPASSFTSTK